MKPREPRESASARYVPLSSWTRSSTWATRRSSCLIRLTGNFCRTGWAAFIRTAPAIRRCANRLMAGLHILKYAEDLSDDEVCARWLENPYYQYFCGEEFFCHSLPLDRSSQDPLASAHGRRPVECFASGKLGRGGEGWGREAGRFYPRRYRYHGGGEGRRLPDRRQADPQGARAPGQTGEARGDRSLVRAIRGSAGREL